MAAKAFKGDILDTVTVELTLPGAEPRTYLSVEMQDVVLNRVKTVEPDEDIGGPLTDRLVLIPRVLKLKYTPGNPDGSPGVPVEETIDCDLAK